MKYLIPPDTCTWMRHHSMKSLIPSDTCTWMRIPFNEISYSTWCMYLNENRIQWNILFHLIQVPEWEYHSMKSLIPPDTCAWMRHHSMKSLFPPDTSTRMRIRLNEISYSTWYMYLNENMIQWNLLFHLIHVPEWEYDSMKSLIPPDTSTWMRIWFNEISYSTYACTWIRIRFNKISYSTWYKYLNENRIQWNILFHLMHVPEWE